MKRALLLYGGLVVWPLWVRGQTADLLPELRVVADRLPEGGGSGRVWQREDLECREARVLDELLADEVSFSLFRRQNSVFGNPTSAGVSLRNTGASAASRTLVLLDGIPQNDPFGGWVYWARYQPNLLESVEIAPSPRAAAWGNLSPAGVILMKSREAEKTRHAIEAGAGSQNSWGLSGLSQVVNEDGTLSATASAFAFETDGFFTLDGSQRGPIDRRLDTRFGGAGLNLTWEPVHDLKVTPGFSYYEEERGNGTPLARNASEALDGSLRVEASNGPLSWQALAYHQDRAFDATFSAVDATRSSETLVLDQFDVPATATGGSASAAWELNEEWTFGAGLDARFVRGETNEDAGGFRRRVAGGEQGVGGCFATAAWTPQNQTTLDLAARLDLWELSEGRRIETALSDGSPLVTDRFADRDGVDPSVSFGLRQELRQGLAAHFNAGTGFRLPTLNELYRPFRVRDDITVANALLDPERFLSLEAGVEWRPEERITTTLAVFQHWIDDAIANVPVTNPADINAILGGPVAPGGSLAQRRNVEQAQVFGIEGDIEARPNDAITLHLGALWSDPRFTNSSYQPLLENQPFSQTPDWRVLADAEWQATEDLALFFGCDYMAARYDDALATRRIAGAASVFLGARYQLGPALCQVRIDNLLDEAIQTGLSGDGLRSHAAPRSLWAGVSLEF